MRHDTWQDAGGEWAVTGGDSSIPGVMAGDWPSRLVEWKRSEWQHREILHRLQHFPETLGYVKIHAGALRQPILSGTPRPTNP